MEKENFTGKMEVIMKEILLMDNFLGLEHIFSQILIKLIEENLEIATWKVKGKKYGLMGENTREISKMVKKMEKGCLSGLMVLNILVPGEMGNNMD